MKPTIARIVHIFRRSMGGLGEDWIETPMAAIVTAVDLPAGRIAVTAFQVRDAPVALYGVPKRGSESEGDLYCWDWPVKPK